MKLGELIDLRVQNKLAIDEANATLKELNRNKEELDYQCIGT